MFDQFQEDLVDVLARAREVGLKKIINVGCGEESSAASVKMADGEFLYATVGLHPYDAADAREELFINWKKLIEDDDSGANIVAIGETGLDYFKAQVGREVQKKSFKMHLELAREVGLPVIVHNREADEDCFELLRQFPEVRAVFHCYGSGIDFARKVWAAGYYTSFTGIITYPSAGDLREVVKAVPLDQFMVETDCPFLAPQGHRGERNEPSYVVETVRMVAEVKGMDFEEVGRISTENSVRFFGF